VSFEIIVPLQLVFVLGREDEPNTPDEDNALKEIRSQVFDF
jgi:hypothetical protein